MVSTNPQNAGDKQCIVCAVKHIFFLTKWSGHLCFQMGCKHSRVNHTTLSKKDMLIAAILCLVLLLNLRECAVSLIHKNYSNNAIFYRLMYIVITSIEISLCVVIFLVQIKIGKRAVAQLVEIINDSRTFGVHGYFNKDYIKHVETYRIKSLLLCTVVITTLTLIVVLCRLSSKENDISHTQEISLYCISYYYLSYAAGTYMLMDLYFFAIKIFDAHIKKLMFDMIWINDAATVSNISKLKKMSHLYLKIYFCFQEYVYYYNPIVIIFMLGLALGVLFNVLEFSFNALNGKINYINIVFMLASIVYTSYLLIMTDSVMKWVSNNNICFNDYN